MKTNTRVALCFVIACSVTVGAGIVEGRYWVVAINALAVVINGLIVLHPRTTR